MGISISKIIEEAKKSFTPKAVKQIDDDIMLFGNNKQILNDETLFPSSSLPVGDTLSVSEAKSDFNKYNLGKKGYSKNKIISNLTKNLKSETISDKSKESVILSIKSINADNFSSVLRSYETTLGVAPLIGDIQKSKQLNEQEKKDALEYILAAGKEYAKKSNIHTEDFMPDLEKHIAEYKDTTSRKDKSEIVSDFRKLVDRKDQTKTGYLNEPNGEIDKGFKQGSAGDCWLLAGIKAFSETKTGKQVINDTVSYDKDTQTFTVNFKSSGKPITVTAEEVGYSNNFSEGDADVRAIEVAADKFFKERGLNGKTDVYGNTTSTALFLLNGSENPYKEVEGQDAISETLDKIQNQKTNDIAAITAVTQKVFDPSFIKGKVGNSEVTLSTGHAYTLVGADNKHVFLVDPSNSNQTIEMDRETYLGYFNSLSYLDFSAEKK